MAAKAPDELPRTRIGRVEAMGRMGVGVGRELLKGTVDGLLAGQNAPEALASGRRAAAEEVFAGLAQMRGVAAKVGQLLSQRPGRIAQEYVERLLDLSNRVPPMGYGLIKTQVVGELGRPPLEIFRRFDREPFAAASLGQVHRAEDQEGRPLAVKVQYPGVSDSVRADLGNVRALLAPVERLLNLADVEATFAEAEARLLEELDYRQEAKNLSDFHAVFADDEALVIPRVFPRSTRRVLIMDLVEGTTIRGYLEKVPAAAARQRAGELLLRSGWKALFQHGLIHADTNPGNYLFRDDGRLGIVDFGCVQRFSPEAVAGLKKMMRAARAKDRAAFEEGALEAGMLSASASSRVRQGVAEGMSAWMEPFMGREHDFASRDYARELLTAREALNDVMRSSGGTTWPAAWLFYGRHVLGQAYLLHRLGVVANYGRVLDEFI